MIAYENAKFYAYHREGLGLLHSLEASVGIQVLHVVQPKEYNMHVYNSPALSIIINYHLHIQYHVEQS